MPNREPMNSKRLATLVAGLFILGLLTWNQLSRSPGMALSGQTMGTTYLIKVHGPGKKGNLHRDIDAALDKVNAQMSTYLESSELSRFNQSEAGVPFQFSPEAYALFKRAIRISETTNGAFDITVGPVVNAYGFGPDAVIKLPTDEELEAMRAYVGYQHLTLDDDTQTVTKDNADVYCDLSAIAKGYGVDVIAQLLDDRGIKNYFIEVGGEVRTKGVNREGLPYWVVGIERPEPFLREVYSTVPMVDRALATSGNYRNFAEVDGKRVSHTIDPKTLQSVEHDLLSASVLHTSCAQADAYATTLMVLGPEDGLAFAEAQGLAVMLLLPAGEGLLDTRTSTAWDKYMAITVTAFVPDTPEEGE